MVEVMMFPRRCHLHRTTMTWEAEEANPSAEGWKCPTCTIHCRIHKVEPLRSNGTGLYCRTCRRHQIDKSPPRPRSLGLEGAAIVIAQSSTT